MIQLIKPQILLLFLLMQGCSSINSERHQIISAMDYILDGLTSPENAENFTIESKFTIELNDSLINYDLRGLMILDSLNFVNASLHKQNVKYKGASIKDYVTSKYQQNIAKEDDSISSLHFIFSAPLFNETNTGFIIYIITVFNSKDTLGWSHQYALCEKKNEQWEYIGAIEVARDRVLNSID